MIDMILAHNLKVYKISVNNKKPVIYFRGKMLPLIESVKLDYDGVIKEYPELKDNPEWREEIIRKFYKKCNDYNSDEEVCGYIVEDLKKWGYKLISVSRRGFRPKKFKL